MWSCKAKSKSLTHITFQLWAFVDVHLALYIANQTTYCFCSLLCSWWVFFGMVNYCKISYSYSYYYPTRFRAVEIFWRKGLYATFSSSEFFPQKVKGFRSWNAPAVTQLWNLFSLSDWHLYRAKISTKFCNRYDVVILFKFLWKHYS